MSRFKTFLLFVIMVLATVVVLRLLSWVPMTIKDEGMRRYRSIEDVKTTLKIRKVFLPSYFPQHLKWPPSEIYAQAKPYTVALMHFNDQNTGEIVLAIRQADSREAKPLR